MNRPIPPLTRPSDPSCSSATPRTPSQRQYASWSRTAGSPRTVSTPDLMASPAVPCTDAASERSAHDAVALTLPAAHAGHVSVTDANRIAAPRDCDASTDASPVPNAEGIAALRKCDASTDASPVPNAEGIAAPEKCDASTDACDIGGLQVDAATAAEPPSKCDAAIGVASTVDAFTETADAPLGVDASTESVAVAPAVPWARGSTAMGSISTPLADHWDEEDDGTPSDPTTDSTAPQLVSVGCSVTGNSTTLLGPAPDCRLRPQIEELFAKRDPARSREDVQRLLRVWNGKEDQLYAGMLALYGPSVESNTACGLLQQGQQRSTFGDTSIEEQTSLPQEQYLGGFLQPCVALEPPAPVPEQKTPPRRRTGRRHDDDELRPVLVASAFTPDTDYTADVIQALLQRETCALTTHHVRPSCTTPSHGQQSTLF